MGFCARINTIICAPTLCLGTPPHPVIARTIAHYNVSPRPPVIAIYTAQYWQLQYRVKAKRQLLLCEVIDVKTVAQTRAHAWRRMGLKVLCVPK